MKCSKCSYKNIKKAKFCKNCGNSFTEEERENAYKKTIYYKLKTLEEWYKKITLNKLTSHWLFRLVVILCVLGYGLFVTFQKGTDVAIEDSKNYETIYNEKLDEYYLLVKEKTNSIPVNLYVPNKVEKIKSIHYNDENKIIDEKEYKNNEEVLFDISGDDYYVLESTYNNKKTKKLKINVYLKNDVVLNNKNTKK